MSVDPDPRALHVRGEDDGGPYRVDASGALGVQVGEGNTQIIYAYGRQTWADGVVPPPLATVSGVVDSPYRGLNTFEERDAPFFFGREAAATQVLARMSRQIDGSGLLVVSGVSGAGKSSLLRAGVLPRLRLIGLVSIAHARSWPCLLFAPSRAPLDELAVRVARLAGADAAEVRRGLDADPAGFALTARQAALAQSGGPAADPEGPAAEHRSKLLLMVDQFEQLFTQCSDEEQRRAFITALHAAATVRHGPDHEPAALVVLGVRADFEARCADYPQLAGAIQDRYLVTAMTERQLRLAITEPAKKAGSSVEDNLADELLREVRTRHPRASSAGVLPLLSHALDQAWRTRAGDRLTLADYERTGGIEGAVADSAQQAYERLTPAQQASTRQVFTRLTACSDGVDTADRAIRAELTESKSAAEARDVEAVLEAFAAERLLILAAGTVEISHEILLTAWPLLRDVWLAETHGDRIVRTRLDDVAAEWIRNSRDSTAFSPNGKVVATGADDEMVRLWDVATHRQIGAPLNGHDGEINAVAFSPDGKVLASGGADDGVVRLWDVASHRQIGVPLLGHSGVVYSVAFSPDGKVLASGGADGTVRLWGVASHRQIGIPLLGHSGKVYSVAFSPDGKVLASGTADGIIRLWDVATRQMTGSWPIYSPVFNLAFSPDSRLLASGNLDDKAQLWDVATRQPIGDPLIGYSLAFSPDGKTLATGSYSHIVRLWDVVSRTGMAALTSNDGVIYSVAFSRDGKTLATGSADGTVRLWDVTTRRQAVALNGRAGTVYSVAFSPDGRTLAAGSADGTVQLWDVTTGQQAGAALNGRAGTVYSVAFSPDGRTLAAGGADGAVRLWKVTTRQQIGGPLKGRDGPIYSVAFSRDGKSLAAGSADGAVQLWDVTTRQQVGDPLNGGTGPVYSVAFSRDGRTVATGSDDDTVRLWDVTTRQQTGDPLIGHADWVLSVTFSPDGRTLVSGSSDGTVRVWDVTTRQQIGDPLNGHDGNIRSVAFSPDGKTLVSGGSDGTARLWDVAYLTGTAKRLCDSVQESLTRTQWEQYVSPGPVYRSVCP